MTVWLHPQAHAPALAELRRVAGCALQLQPLPAELFDQQLARVYADSVDGGDDSVLALEAGNGLEAVLRTDVAIKSSAGTPQHLLECLAVELCSSRP